MAKIAIFLLSGTASSEMAKAFHALLYARQLKEAGEEVKLVFDGAGTGWIPELGKPENRLHSLFLRVKELGVIDGVCDFCAGIYSNKEAIQQQGLPLAGEADGHPDIVRLVREGYQVVVL